MQHSLNAFLGSSIRAKDGDLGQVEELYFDNTNCAIRYLLVNTGSTFFGRKVLISVTALDTPNWNKRTIPVNLTCDQVRQSPNINTERPVHRQHEIKLHDYYVWPPYWDTAFNNSCRSLPNAQYVFSATENLGKADNAANSLLCSTHQVTGYHIHATNGDIGHVEDFIIDDRHWNIRFLIVDMANFLPGRKVLISHVHIKGVRWSSNSLYLNISKKEVVHSPVYSYELC